MPSAQFKIPGQWIRLDRNYRLVEASPVATATLQLNIGAGLWDIWPAAEEVFGPIYEQAWNDGLASGVRRFAGNIVCVHVVREIDTILVAIEALTVEGLRDVLDSLADEVAVEDATQRAPHHPRLRLLHQETG